MSELNTARIRLARQRKGLQQIVVSRLLGVAEGLAGQWERSSKSPRSVN
jgi:DNA-binding transcriptional regulator YiaG